jgi:regulator of protease activity HflC (stomatin/prohibitin superfamily)
MLGEWTNKLAELIKEFFSFFKFWTVVPEYGESVILRLGKFSRVLRPGIHWMAPMKVDVELGDNVKPQLKELTAISITLKDSTQLTIRASFLWSITDIRTFKLEVEDADSALAGVDGIIQEFLFQYTWEELMALRSRAAEDQRRNNLPQHIRTQANKMVHRFGVQVEEVFVGSFTKTSLKDGMVRVLGHW